MSAVTFKIGDVVEVTTRIGPSPYAGLRFRVTELKYDLVGGIRIHSPTRPQRMIEGILVGEEVRFFARRVCVVGRQGFGAWFKEHSS